jgi:hypothetical protein
VAGGEGFLVDRFGVLSWHGRPDIHRAAMIVVAGALGQIVGWVRRAGLERRQNRSFVAQWHLLVQDNGKKETLDG